MADTVKKERWIPPQVRAAKLRRDTLALMEMSRKGNETQERQREELMRMPQFDFAEAPKPKNARFFPADMPPDERTFAELCAWMHHQEMVREERSRRGFMGSLKRPSTFVKQCLARDRAAHLDVCPVD